ncbi:MAG TPA: methyltransferase type 11 [Bacteroidales bacterium]|jgi:arsenite methyltransferase|nr:methyltransferase type 11 [Bacteroidales bacterium]
MALVEINKRYSELAVDDCCLSCGGAVDHSKPQPGEICLDLGSGRGTDVIRMAEEVGEKGYVYGLDISDGMLKKAESTARKMGVENLRFIKSELEIIPLAHKSIDLIISNCTINHADDKQAVWNEIYRVLKEGGRFVVSDIYSTSPVPEEYKNDPEAIAECWAGAVTRQEYMDQLAKAGFKSIEVIEESVPYEKGKVKVSSITIKGTKGKGCCN